MDGPGFFISDDISWLSILAALSADRHYHLPHRRR
jgi:hypothetical protein